MVASEGFDPMLILFGSLLQSRFGNGIDAVHVAEEMDDMRLSGEQRKITLDDDAIETVVYAR